LVFKHVQLKKIKRLCFSQEKGIFDLFIYLFDLSGVRGGGAYLASSGAELLYAYFSLKMTETPEVAWLKKLKNDNNAVIGKTLRRLRVTKYK